MPVQRTQVAIMGGGSAGLLLSQVLHQAGIDSVVLEERSRDDVIGRFNACILEHGTVDLLREAEVHDRLMQEGLVQDGIQLSFWGEPLRVDLRKHTHGKTVMIYSQSELTRDLLDARDRMNGVVINQAAKVKLHDIDRETPYVTFLRNGIEHRIDCDFVIGCDGFHGVSRRAIPREKLLESEIVHPFGWLGVLAESPPLDDEIVYAIHDDGFALCSIRTPTSSRYFIQVSLTDKLADWSDDRFWAALKVRLPENVANRLTTGPTIAKSIVALRSFVAEPMRYGRLFLAGDAAHIALPTAAKGLNLAVSDVFYLSRALKEYYRDGSTTGLDSYSQTALKRIWQVERFAWSMTRMLHVFPEDGVFGKRRQRAEKDYLGSSEAAQQTIAENYVGLPF